MQPAKKDWVVERVEHLTALKAHSLTTSDDIMNIDAVIKAYLDGTLKRPTPGKGVVFLPRYTPFRRN